LVLQIKSESHQGHSTMLQ